MVPRFILKSLNLFPLSQKTPFRSVRIILPSGPIKCPNYEQPPRSFVVVFSIVSGTSPGGGSSLHRTSPSSQPFGTFRLFSRFRSPEFWLFVSEKKSPLLSCLSEDNFQQNVCCCLSLDGSPSISSFEEKPILETGTARRVWAPADLIILLLVGAKNCAGTPSKKRDPRRDQIAFDKCFSTGSELLEYTEMPELSVFFAHLTHPLEESLHFIETLDATFPV